MKYLFKFIHTTNRINLFNYKQLTNNLQNKLQTTYNMSVHDLCLQLAEKEVERMKKEEEVIRLKIQIKSGPLDSPIPPSATDNTDIKVSVTEESIKGASPPDGVKRPKASRIKPIQLVNNVKTVRAGECCAVLNKFQNPKSFFINCSNGSNASGLCRSCQKNHLRDGYHRYGLVESDFDYKITAEIFGTDDEISKTAKSHQTYISRLKNNL